MTPQTDAERILGQIARGEVRANAAAAREIAARHQAAYGDAFRGTPAQALLNSITGASVLAIRHEPTKGVAA